MIYCVTADQVRILMRLPRCRTHLVLAREMRMSLSTLKRHLDHIRAQLEVENDAGAVTEALRRQIIRLDDFSPGNGQ